MLAILHLLAMFVADLFKFATATAESSPASPPATNPTDWAKSA
jgi:hypothetical protein